MEQILSKLAEIEITAKHIKEEADQTKNQLSSEMEQQCKTFDSELETKTNAKIQQIRADLEKDKDKQLALLRNDTEQAFAALDSYYEKNHECLSRDLFHQLLDR